MQIPYKLFCNTFPCAKKDCSDNYASFVGWIISSMGCLPTMKPFFANLC